MSHANRERGKPPLRYRLRSASRRRRGPKRLVAILALLAVPALAFCGFSLWRGAQRAQQDVERMRASADKLQRQAAAFDLAGAAATMTQLRHDADDARDTTSGPLWATATIVPVLGDDVAAARNVSSSVAGVLDAAQPLEQALPKLQRTKGQIDVDALANIAGAMPRVSAAVSQADTNVAVIDTSGLTPQLADGVRTLSAQLKVIRDPLANAVPGLQVLPAMLGQTEPKQWLVLLQQDAEARGTGGLVGAFAVVTANHGKLTLETTAQRSALTTRQIPATAVPQELRDLWGKDITDWAGLNLSPHFPWTGQLVSAGWASKTNSKVDYVVALDQYSVAGVLAGTGPVQLGRDTVSSETAVNYLSRVVYQRYPDYRDVDRVTQALITETFGRIAGGQLDLKNLVKGVADQAGQRRVLVWAADPNEELTLQGLSVGGALPTNPGPFAMAVVNNGGGNKMDAYLKVHTDYQPGTCAAGSRIGTMAVTLQDIARPATLTRYQSVRSDLLDKGIKKWVVGSNRILLDLYGPVGANAPLVTVDGVRQAPFVGADRGHAVWRVIVPIVPGQQRVVRAVVVQPVNTQEGDAPPKVMVQPMAIPATATVGAAPNCTD